MLYHLNYDLSSRDDVSYVMAYLYKSSRKQIKRFNTNTSRRLYSAMSETLQLQNTSQEMFVSIKYSLNIRGNSKRQCFENRVYNGKKLETEYFDCSSLIEVRCGQLLDGSPESGKLRTVFEDIFQVQLLKKFGPTVS